MAPALSNALAELDRRHRPQVLAHEDTLALSPAFTGLLGEPGLRRGSTFTVGGALGGSALGGSAGCAAALGVTTLSLGLLAAASAGGAWIAVVDLPGLGIAAAAELGFDLERLVVVPDSASRFTTVVAALLDGCDGVLVGVPEHLDPATVRRLATRARERRTVLVLSGGAARHADCRTSGVTPVDAAGVDARLEVSAGRWVGLGEGSGRLQARLAEVVATRRRRAPSEVRERIWLPGPDGKIEPFGAVEIAGEGSSSSPRLAEAR